MSVPWWQLWSVEEMSPLNAVAVVAAQLDPPNWTMAPARDAYRFSQLWWLCWYARPDLRKQQMEAFRKSQFITSLDMIVIHPETMAEWSEPPPWTDRGRSRGERERYIRAHALVPSWWRGLHWQEWHIRNHALQTCSLSPQQCRHIHPQNWSPASLGQQAAQSESHGQVLLDQIQVLDDEIIAYVLVHYVKVSHRFSGTCGEYLLTRATTIPWEYWMAESLVNDLQPFPDELVPCILNSPSMPVFDLRWQIPRFAGQAWRGT